MKIRLMLLVLLLFISGWFSQETSAHESQPAFLKLQQVTKDRYEVIWRAPIYYGRPHPAKLELPEDWRDSIAPTERELPDSLIFRRVITTHGQSLDGRVIRFRGLENTITTVFVNVTLLDGTSTTAAVRPGKPFIMIRGERPWHLTAGEYTMLGLNHILQGVDHLLFVLGLMLIVKGRMMLFKTVTAFTLSHSITLGVATLGYASVPLPPLNATIALSILFLGPEIVRSWKQETSLTIRFPWCVAFLFGLLHGFGFASGLTTTGMPKSELLPALLFFNVGVELGQLAFVFVVLALVRSCKILDIRWPRWAELAPGYAVGSLGAFWTIQRVVIMVAS